MKTIIVGMVFLFGSLAFGGDSYVRGYVRRDGTYVAPHHRTTPDDSINNNYGTRGNLNPYTGNEGTQPRNPYQLQDTYNPGNNTGNTPTYNYNLENE